jgi:hypothetical protein
MNIFEQIKIGSSFDAKGFKQAETASQKLTNTVKGLAKTLGVAFGTAAVVSFGKASVKAFIQDDNAARSLGVTLKNLGLETGNTSIYVNDLISRMEKQTGILDDQLRPAMDRLLRATGSVSKAQDLLGLALDISAGTGKDLTAVSQGLQKAYLGNTASLSKLGVGLSKAELTSSSFEEIQKRLTVLFAGQASSAAESYAGQLNKLAIASNNVKEIIGKGIVDALVVLSTDDTVSNLASDMEKLATYTADVIRGFGLMASALQKIPGISGFDVGMIPILGTYIKVLQEAGAKSRRIAEASMGKNPIQSGTYLKNQKTITKLTKEQSAAQAKILADKKSQAILDKANLALNKGTDLFNMDAIQVNAALINQAEQLGKVTNQAQLLAITTDIARLKIKQDIANLEDAIASKDDARITAATNQLNTDLKIYSALTNQSLKLADIKSILDSLVPKDLINLANLDAAIAKLNAINTATGQKTVGTTSSGATTTSPSGIPIGDYVPKIPTSGVSMAAIEEFAAAATARANAMADLIDAQNAIDAAKLKSQGITVNLYANTVANPDELVGLIQDTIIRINKQGDYLTTAGAL